MNNNNGKRYYRKKIREMYGDRLDKEMDRREAEENAKPKKQRGRPRLAKNLKAIPKVGSVAKRARARRRSSGADDVPIVDHNVFPRPCLKGVCCLSYIYAAAQCS